MKKTISIVITIAIFLLSFLLRAKMILLGDFFFLSDQARDLILVKDIVINHKLTLIGARAGLGGLFHGPLWIYMLALPFLLTNGNPLFIATFFIIVSLAIVFLGYYLGLRLFGKSGGFLLALFLAGSSTLYQTVPYTSNAQMMPLILIFYLFFLLLFIRHKERFFNFLSAAFFAGLGFQFEAAFSIFLLPFLFITAFVINNRKIFQFKRILLTIFIFVTPLFSHILFDLRHNFLMTRSMISLFSRPEGIKPIKGYERYSDLAFRVGDRFISLLESFKTFLPTSSSNLHFLFLAIFIFSFLVFIKDFLKKRIDKEYLTILFFPLFIYTAYIFYPLPVWGHYTLSMPVIIAVLFLLAIKKIQPFLLGKILVSLFLLLYIRAVLNIVYLQYFKSKTYKPTSDGSFVNQLKVVDSIFADSKGEKFSYFVYNSQVFTYGMDYLMWYRGSKTYSFIPSSEKKKGLMYLVMYPNNNDKSAHDYWVKHVVKTEAPILNKKIYNGEIAVEKRLISTDEEPIDSNYYLDIR